MTDRPARRTGEHHSELARLADWEPYLREHSGLPGPRANLGELAQAVADLGELALFERFAAFPDEYLAAWRTGVQAVRTYPDDTAALPSE
jgi:hypothetical protein